MKTSTQKNFKNKMNEINKQIKKNDSEKIFSYINNKFISSYYENSESNPRKRIRALNIYKYTILIVSFTFGLIFYLAAPYSKLTAIPFTLMMSSIVLLLFGMIHPSLAFFDGKSRIVVILFYGFLILMGFIIAGLTLQ